MKKKIYFKIPTHMVAENRNRVYKAKLLEGGNKYKVSWIDENLKIQETVYDVKTVEKNLRTSFWIPLKKKERLRLGIF